MRTRGLQTMALTHCQSVAPGRSFLKSAFTLLPIQDKQEEGGQNSAGGGQRNEEKPRRVVERVMIRPGFEVWHVGNSHVWEEGEMNYCQLRPAKRVCAKGGTEKQLSRKAPHVCFCSQSLCLCSHGGTHGARMWRVGI